MVPMVVATVTATAVAFYVDGYSIYSARLPSRPPGWRSTLVAALGEDRATAPLGEPAAPAANGTPPAAARGEAHLSPAGHEPEPGARPGPARHPGPSP
jgi:hypothetical protein